MKILKENITYTLQCKLETEKYRCEIEKNKLNLVSTGKDNDDVEKNYKSLEKYLDSKGVKYKRVENTYVRGSLEIEQNEIEKIGILEKPKPVEEKEDDREELLLENMKNCFNELKRLKDSKELFEIIEELKASVTE